MRRGEVKGELPGGGARGRGSAWWRAVGAAARGAGEHVPGGSEHTSRGERAVGLRAGVKDEVGVGLPD